MPYPSHGTELATLAACVDLVRADVQVPLVTGRWRAAVAPSPVHCMPVPRSPEEALERLELALEKATMSWSPSRLTWVRC